MKRNKNNLFIGLLLVLFLAVVFTFLGVAEQEDVLEVYTRPNRVEDTDEDKKEDIKVDMSVYMDGENGFSISIPTSWGKVVKDGYVTYIHPESGASIQLQVNEYNPALNNISAESASALVTDSGYTFVNFNRLTNSSYELTYQDHTQATVYDYLEEVYWDRTKVIDLVCTFKDDDYSAIIPYYEKILSSFAWEQASPVPDGLYLQYFPYGNFETGIPDTWYTSVNGNVFYAMDEAGVCSMAVQVSEYSGSFENLTQNDVDSLIRGNKQNFIFVSYNKSDTGAVATTKYVSNNVQYNNQTFLFCNGTYLYTIMFDYESGALDESVPQMCMAMFRAF